LSKLRYHKIIIATDADVDGAHITTLLLTLFFRYYRPLIEEGRVFIAQPPLYKIKKGKETHYVYSDEEKNKLMKELGASDADLMDTAGEGESEENSELEGEGEGEELESETAGKTVKPKSNKISTQRYKGLGEMNPEELWETTMNPNTRVLKQVTIKDLEETDKTFDILMGSEVEPRKIFIQTHAKLANVDV